MDEKTVLQMMKDYITSAHPDENLDNLASLPVPSVLKSSFDMVEFVMHLEDKLELEEEIELEELGSKLARDITFGQLAQEVVEYMEKQKDKSEQK